jgi:predicted alpha/beta hydrolase
MLRKIEFPSKDGLVISADYYQSPASKGLLLLCHRSHCNRAEYRQTAPRLVSLGFSCLAIDLRSGMKVFGETNETSQRAKEKKLPTGYLDARIDVEAGIEMAYQLNSQRPILLFGSSYSASLALLCAIGHPWIEAVICFSPGEFLKGISLQQQIKELDKPIFATAASSEIAETAMLFRQLDPRYLTFFKPTVKGFHGSKTLWNSITGNEQYWTALEGFLRNPSVKP